jgi:transposase
VLVRLVGQAPVKAIVYYLQKLRCNPCGALFTAELPEGVDAEQKYDPTVGSIIALLKYGNGMPFHRQETLQGNVGIPLSDSTQWDIVNAQAKRAEPAWQELVRQAAQGDVVHNDDSATSKGWRVQWEIKPTGAIAKSPVAWMAGRRETE